MISATRIFSRGYNLTGRETVKGPLLYDCFDNHIKNRADIYGLHFQGHGAIIKDTPLLNILDGGVYLPMSVQNILHFTRHITGGHKKGASFLQRVSLIQ